MSYIKTHTEDDWSEATKLSLAKAHEIATIVQKDDTEWTYSVWTDEGSKVSYVKCHDEDGHFLGWF